MAVKVVQVVDGEETDLGEFETLLSVAISGATGMVTYRLDPLQDSLIKLVVVSDVNKVAEQPPEVAPQHAKAASK